jgi:hypothetical protein
MVRQCKLPVLFNPSSGYGDIVAGPLHKGHTPEWDLLSVFLFVRTEALARQSNYHKKPFLFASGKPYKVRYQKHWLMYVAKPTIIL